MMKPLTTKPFAARLVQARHMRRWSLRELAARITAEGVAISAAALGKYEKGEMLPSPANRRVLCDVLGVNEDFFERPMRMPLGEVKFRKRSSLRAKEELALREHASDFFDRYAELEELLGVDGHFVNPLADWVVQKEEDVEQAAVLLRDHWGLGQAAIASVVGLLEAKNLMVYLDKAPETFDGFAGRAGNRDVIALNSTFPVDRLRFSGMHELGHVVLHFAPGQFTEKAQDNLCHRFAGAMLIPREVFQNVFGKGRQRVAVQELMRLKTVFGMSCAAIMKRAATLGLVAESMMERFWTSWSVRGYRTNDPGPCPFGESCSRFDIMLSQAVGEGVITIGKAAVLAGEPEDAFRKKLEVFP